MRLYVLVILLAFGCGGTTNETPTASTRPAPKQQRPLEEPPPKEKVEAPALANAEPPAAEVEATSLVLAASGDALLHIKVNQSAKAHGWDHVFEGLAHYASEDDLTFVNLETPLALVREPAANSTPILGAPPEVAAALLRAKVDVLGCANNHAYDQRSVGLAQTLAAIRKEGIVAVGAHEERPKAYAHRLVVQNGLKVAFLSYTRRINGSPGDSPRQAWVASTKNQSEFHAALKVAREAADLVVLALHWSSDLILTPRVWQREMAKELIARGVDVILGTGPHVLQEVSRLQSERGDAVVAYSLGNLVSNQGRLYRYGRSSSKRAHPAVTMPETRDAVLLRIPLEKKDGRVVAGQITAKPMWTKNNHWQMYRRTGEAYDIQVVPYSALSDELATARAAEVQRMLGAAVLVESTGVVATDTKTN